jgi:hypothetical protein
VKVCSVTVDIDSLNSNFKGFGLVREEYSYREFDIGIENILNFFDRFKIKATFFFVAQDLEFEKNARWIKIVTTAGHEIASHSYSHPQGFRFLSHQEKEYELKRSKEVLEAISGQNVFGFRAPGWNISDDALPILRSLGYRYDSSVFPTSLAWLMKAMHYFVMRKRDKLTRTTLGHLYYAFAPSSPYTTDEKRVGKRGVSSFIEFPIQVAGFFRLPFYGTFHLARPMFINRAYNFIKESHTINYQMHLSDFVDYTLEDFQDEIPEKSGSYIPLSLKTKISDKLKLWEKIFNMMARDYRFQTLQYCAQKIESVI